MARVDYGGESRSDASGPRPRAAARGGAPRERTIRISNRFGIRQRSCHVADALFFIGSGIARALRHIHDYCVVRSDAVAHIVDVKEVANKKFSCVGVA